MQLGNKGANISNSSHKSVVARDGGSSSTSIPPDKEQEVLEGIKETNKYLQLLGNKVVERNHPQNTEELYMDIGSASAGSC